MADPNRGEIGFVEEPQPAEGKKKEVGMVAQDGFKARERETDNEARNT